MINNNEIHLCVTGLRAAKLFDEDYTDEIYSSKKVKKIIATMLKFLEENKCIKRVYIGMSSGIDLLFGIAVYKYKQRNGKDSIELYCCIPGIRQTKRFTEEEKRQYQFIIREVSDRVECLSRKHVSSKLFIERNKYMVNKTHMTVAFWDLNKIKSGTYGTMCYSKKKGNPVYLFDVNDINHSGWWFAPNKKSHMDFISIWDNKNQDESELLTSY